ncbi:MULTISPECIES: hypothetical protein [unclassified Mycobacterium]|uniref:hypothetical protein n=1 Tax=unclassified Mycobacterium TaxID=2642494 RepID=UPI0029C61F58|nr:MULTISPECIES: hypothetical protein [unclassified Mycobacterium]
MKSVLWWTVLLIVACVNWLVADGHRTLNTVALCAVALAALSVYHDEYRDWRWRHPDAVAELVDVLDWCQGCDNLWPRHQMGLDEGGAYRCYHCRNILVPFPAALAPQPIAATKPQQRVIRAALDDTIVDLIVHEVMVPGRPPDMVVLRLTEHRNAGAFVLPPGVKVGMVERPDGTLIPIISSG